MGKYVISKSKKYQGMSYVYSKEYSKIMMIPENIVYEKNLENIFDIKFEEILKNRLIEKSNDRNISLITVIVSNMCNMKCSYCYEDLGTFGKSRNIISKEMVERVVEFILSMYDKVDTISFFGGEPMLAINYIDYFCNLMKDKYEEKLILKIPKYTIVTNGTLLNEESLNILKKHGISVCVSVDGFKSTHNMYRLYSNFMETYDDVYANMIKLKDNNLLYSIQCTYFNSYIEKNISIYDIKKYYYKKLGIKNFIFNDINIDFNHIDSKLRGEELSIERKKLLKGNCLYSNLKLFLDTGVTDMDLYYFLQRMIKVKECKYICRAAYDEIAINLDGDIYPCRTFASEIYKNKFNMGNVKYFDNKKFKTIKKLIKTLNTRDKSCEKCKSFVLCGKCLAIYMSSGDYNIDVYKKCNVIDQKLNDEFAELLNTEISLTDIVEKLIAYS